MSYETSVGRRSGTKTKKFTIDFQKIGHFGRLISSRTGLITAVSVWIPGDGLNCALLGRLHFFLSDYIFQTWAQKMTQMRVENKEVSAIRTNCGRMGKWRAHRRIQRV